MGRRSGTNGLRVRPHFAGRLQWPSEGHWRHNTHSAPCALGTAGGVGATYDRGHIMEWVGRGVKRNLGVGAGVIVVQELASGGGVPGFDNG
ncbi:MAG: hypothetical protein ACYSYL_21285 [Planctomycetota bacterium]